MEIKEIKLLDVVREKERVVLLVEMAVGSGTYVRSVAEEIGRRLGVPRRGRGICGGRKSEHLMFIRRRGLKIYEGSGQRNHIDSSFQIKASAYVTSPMPAMQGGRLGNA